MIGIIGTSTGSVLWLDRAASRVGLFEDRESNGPITYIPPLEIAAVAFEHDHLGVVMTVEIAAADPSLYLPLVDRIIASIRCF